MRVSESSVYRRWWEMLQRCTNPNNAAWKNYGGRGIKVCTRWKTFKLFHQDMGDPPPGRTLERIDNDGNYEPKNCRWATRQQQRLNCRRVHWLTVGGKTLPLSYWGKRNGISDGTIRSRINKLGWSIEKAVTAAPRKLCK